MKILRELEAHVRRYDMLRDDLWDREEPIHAVYEWCVNAIGRTPEKFSAIWDYIQDALEQLDLE